VSVLLDYGEAFVGNVGERVEVGLKGRAEPVVAFRGSVSA